jgi:2,5-diamino-6-(ribosylamino)-4(3H)-pyrimidinone 5'-phosphate reductase
MSADGKLSTYERRQVKISGAKDFRRVDRLKADADAIMVGIGTVLADDPSLTVKDPELIRTREADGRGAHPVRVVVDSHGRIPLDSAVLHRGPGLRVVGVSAETPPERRAEIGRLARVEVAGEHRVDLGLFLERLYECGIRRLMVEGGGTLIASLLDAGLVDEVYVFVGNMIIGGAAAPTLADGKGRSAADGFVRLSLASAEPCEEGVLLHWIVEKRE